jgi:cytochrome c-type biogenesis protein
MTSTVTALSEFFLIGVATPLSAACVLPLYPAFIGYLAAAGDGDRARSPAVLGILVVAGVLTFMTLTGLLAVVVIGDSAGLVVQRVSPFAFALMAVVGVVLAVAPGGFSRIPAYEPPHLRYPTASAFVYGFFFGAIILPCNPATLTLFFARATTILPGLDTQFEAILGFVAFGLGIGAPLLTFAFLSQPFSERITRVLARYSKPINRVVGAVLAVIAVYYLLFIFQVIPGSEGLQPPVELPSIA